MLPLFMPELHSEHEQTVYQRVMVCEVKDERAPRLVKLLRAHACAS